MFIEPRTARRRPGSVTLNPFVVLCDVTISVILCLATCIALLSLERAPAGLDALRRERNALRQERDALRAQVAELQAELRQLRVAVHEGVPAATSRARTTAEQELNKVPRSGWRVLSGFDSVLVRFEAGGLFNSGSAELINTAQVDRLADEIARLIEYVRRLDPNGQGRVMEIQVQGHSDRAGEPTFDNWGLAMRRADRVRRQLVANPQLRQYDYLFSVAAYRWHRPVNPEPYQAGQVNVSENRRIDVRIIFHNPMVPPDSQIVIRPMDTHGQQH